MDRAEQKKTARKTLSVRAKHDRFITSYLQVKYPKEYEEAQQYYQQLNVQYPKKRDLTKTTEFLYLATGHRTFVQYYRQRIHAKKTKKISEKTDIVDNMVLQIPLMNSNDMDTVVLEEKADESDMNTVVLEEKADESLVIPDDIYDNLIRELRNDPELYTIFNDMNVDTSQQPLDLSQEQQIEINIPGHVSQEQQQTDEIISDLEASWPELFEDGQTPLENELEALDY